MNAHGLLQHLFLSKQAGGHIIPDPGNGKVIQIGIDQGLVLLTSAGAETRILGADAGGGQSSPSDDPKLPLDLEVTLEMAVDGGDIVLTFTPAVSGANTVVTFNDVGDWATFRVCTNSSNSYKWQLVASGGVNFS